MAFHDAEADFERGHAAFGVAQCGEAFHFFGDREVGRDGGAVFFEAFLKVEKEELARAGGAEEVLRVAQDRDRGGVVVLLEPSLSSASEGVNKKRAAGAAVGIAAREESAFFQGEAVGFCAHIAEPELFGERADGQGTGGFDFAEKFVLPAGGVLWGSGRHGRQLAGKRASSSGRSWFLSIMAAI